MHTRLATAGDFGGIMNLYLATADAMVGTPHDCCWRRGGHPTPAFIKAFIHNQGMFVVEENGAIVAAVGMDHDIGHDYGDLPWLVDAPDEHVTAIHLLAVREDRRGTGIARRLLRACLDEARRRGMQSARLDATANNAPAIALYQSEGFLQVGAASVDVGLEENPRVPFVVMERPIQQTRACRSWLWNVPSSKTNVPVPFVSPPSLPTLLK